MKKILVMLLCIVTAISCMCPCVYAEESESAATEVTYDNHDIIKEVAQAYDRRSVQVQYDQLNARRHIYASPEDGSAQRTLYLDCSSFVNSCYREAFGVNVMPYEISEKSPNTVYFTSYAKENPGNPDVVGYWENADYTTDEAKANILAEVRGMLEVGDLLVYRHGKTSDSSGHVYIYIGEDTFLHCFGGGSYERNESNPALSYDSTISEEADGMIATIKANTIFNPSDNKRYLFRKTTNDTVRNFCLLRPLARGLTPTEETLGRMAIAGLVMEKTASVFENSAVYSGDVITYTISLKNTTSAALSSVPITDVIPAGTEFVSGSSGVSAEGTQVSWTGDVAASTTVTVTYDVRVTATTPGTLIKSDSTYVNGVKLGNITHSLSGYSEIYGLLMGEKARDYAEKSTQFDSGLSFALSLYKSVLGKDIFTYSTVGAALDDLIDTENRTCRTDTDISKMIAPNLYGGYSIRYGWLYDSSQNDRTRLISESELQAGDIILADYSGGSIVYVYAGNSTLVAVEDGVCKALTIGSNIYANPDNILISLLAYDRFAILRPSMTNTASSLSVESIAVATPPTKTEYVSGESFDAAGMVVNAVLSDGTAQEIKGYSISPDILNYPESSVTVSFCGLTATVDVSVALNTISVSEASLRDEGSKVKVEGIVVGASNEGYNSHKELLIKDVSEDTIIAVRDIKYGSYPTYGYAIGDRIVIVATVSADGQYTEKKYLGFSSTDNGTKDSTIISSGNESTYKLDDVVVIDSWTKMKEISKDDYNPYTYFKFTGGVYMYYYADATDGITVYRVHKNADATTSSDIKIDSNKKYFSFRENFMSPNLGSDWTKLFFDEVVTGYPGIKVDKDFYALYVGGNNTYLQFVILDESWIYDSDFGIKEVGEDKKSAQINVPTAGTYSMIFADYEENVLKNIDIVPVTVKDNETGRMTVNMIKDTFTLTKGDKVMLWDGLTNIKPLCSDLEIE